MFCCTASTRCCSDRIFFGYNCEFVSVFNNSFYVLQGMNTCRIVSVVVVSEYSETDSRRCRNLGNNCRHTAFCSCNPVWHASRKIHDNFYCPDLLGVHNIIVCIVLHIIIIVIILVNCICRRSDNLTGICLDNTGWIYRIFCRKCDSCRK